MGNWIRDSTDWWNTTNVFGTDYIGIRNRFCIYQTSNKINMSKKYDFSEWGEGEWEPQPPRFDAVAMVVAIMVAVGLALVISIK